MNTKYLNETFLEWFDPLTTKEKLILSNNPSDSNIIEIFWIDTSMSNSFEVGEQIKDIRKNLN